MMAANIDVTPVPAALEIVNNTNIFPKLGVRLLYPHVLTPTPPNKPMY
jgi:hypothetical protein